MNKPEPASTAWHLLFDIADKLRDEVGRDDAEQLVGLTFNQLRMIKIVYSLNREFPDGVTLKVLAESLRITPAAASEMVDVLVRKNVLQRNHNPQDRRAVAIKLSDEAKAKFGMHEQRFDHLTAGFLDTLSESERTLFLKNINSFHSWVLRELGD